MARTIWKFELRITDEQTVEMPALATLLSVAVQGNSLCLWALVNPDLPKCDYTFAIYGTGHPVPGGAANPGLFIGTALMPLLAWHVFLLEPGAGNRATLAAGRF
jgi:hypothetical protein